MHIICFVIKNINNICRLYLHSISQLFIFTQISKNLNKPTFRILSFKIMNNNNKLVTLVGTLY